MNSNEDWYQTAIKKFKINEILYKKFSGKPTRIGRGGFGLIYKTECNSIGTVAIKEITIGIEDDEAYIDEGLYYLVLEYANQGNLREFLIKKKSCDNCFEWEERVRLAVQIVEGLGYLHEHIYTSCWETEPNSRPLIEGVLSRLKSMSLEPVFEEDDKISTISLFQYRDTSRDSTSEYSNNVSSLTIPDDLILPTNNVTCKRCDSKFTDQNWCYDYNDPENRPNTLDLLEELHIFTASPLRKRQFEDADSRGLQPLQISPPLQKNKRLINPSSEYFSNQFSRGADYSFF
ncbi:9237_t:CDS:2 [Rhizophagus irregularis]|nr:9237_t:CDS:2 [Rhizophagus irregularis]